MNREKEFFDRWIDAVRIWAEKGYPSPAPVCPIDATKAMALKDSVFLLGREQVLALLANMEDMQERIDDIY